MKVKHVNHIGINVEDLQKAVDFFTTLGFTVQGEAAMEGKLLDGVTGLTNAKTKLIMVDSPDKQLSLEIIKYINPATEGDHQHTPNAHGFGHIAFEVEGLDEIVGKLNEKGYHLVGSVQNYENIWKLCYISGPEGIMVELAEKISE